MSLEKRLAPVEAAIAAQAVYETREYGSGNGKTVDACFKRTAVGAYFDLKEGDAGNATRLKATTGARSFIRHQTSSVYATGVNNGFEKHGILICRGTEGAHDWLTDIKTKPVSSMTGHTVHHGFNGAFNNFRSDLLSCVTRHQSQVLHCVGHSLGGALANLAADTITAANLNTKVVLYTFGAPRVGTYGFAEKLTSNSKVLDIFRVYHGGDPVSMLPLWPFTHAPQPRGECFIGKFSGFNPMQHKMDAYIASVKNVSSFEMLRRDHPTVSGHIDEWLTSKDARKFCGLNAYNLYMLNKAIALVVKKVMTIGWNAIGGVVYAGLTLTDQLAILFDKAQQMSTEDSGLVLALMKRMISMAGLNIKPQDNLTLAFIKQVLRMFMMVVGHAASAALRAASTVVR